MYSKLSSSKIASNIQMTLQLSADLWTRVDDGKEVVWEHGLVLTLMLPHFLWRFPCSPSSGLPVDRAGEEVIKTGRLPDLYCCQRAAGRGVSARPQPSDVNTIKMVLRVLRRRPRHNLPRTTLKHIVQCATAFLLLLAQRRSVDKEGLQQVDGFTVWFLMNPEDSVIYSRGYSPPLYGKGDRARGRAVK